MVQESASTNPEHSYFRPDLLDDLAAIADQRAAVLAQNPRFHRAEPRA